VAPSSVPSCLTLKMKVLRSFETSRTTYSTTELDIPEGFSLQSSILIVKKKIGTARQFLKKKLPNIKFRENLFNGFRIFMGVQTDGQRF
jgi:hypothetical protein